MFRSLIFLSIFLLSSSSTFAGRVTGEGRFFALEDDSIKFIKKQLLASAYRDILSKELTSMGLDNELFWKNFDSRFDNYFAPIQENLKSRYANKEGEVGKDKRELYQKSLRLKRLGLKGKFGRLSRVISSYSVKKRSRSTQMVNSRYLVISAKVARKQLADIFDRFTKVNNARNFKTLYVGINFVLNSLSWSDLGVDVETDFTKVVLEHWVAKLEEKLGTSVEQVVFADKGKVESMRAEINRSADLEEGHLMGLTRAGSDLWLMGDITINLEENDSFLEKRTYSFSGGVLLYDLRKKTLRGHFDFVPEKTTYSTSDRHELSSHLASLVYRLPLVFFQDIKKKLSKLRADERLAIVEIIGIKNLSEAYKFSSFLNKKGVVYGVDSKIKRIDKGRTQIVISYNGKKEGLSKLLYSLKGQKIGKRYELNLPDEDNPFSFRMSQSEFNTDQTSL